MPKCEHFNPIAADAIVEVIANPGEMQAPSARARNTGAPTLGSALKSKKASERSSSKASGAR
jgi:hypothetical protein